MWASGRACVHNVASLLWAIRQRPYSAAPALQKPKQRWSAAGVRVEGAWRCAHSCNASIIHAKTFIGKCIGFVNLQAPTERLHTYGTVIYAWSLSKQVHKHRQRWWTAKQMNRHIHHRKSVNQLLVTSAWYLDHIQSFRAKIMGSYCGYAVADALQLHAHTSVQTLTQFVLDTVF